MNVSITAIRECIEKAVKDAFTKLSDRAILNMIRGSLRDFKVEKEK